MATVWKNHSIAAVEIRPNSKSLPIPMNTRMMITKKLPFTISESIRMIFGKNVTRIAQPSKPGTGSRFSRNSTMLIVAPK